MRNKILLLIVIVLSGVFLIVSSKYHTTFFMMDANNQTIIVKDKGKNTIDEIDLEEYIIGVVAAEMPASFNIEALKAQAVAARTYAIYKINTSNKEYDVVSDISNQSYITVNKMKEKWGKDFNKYYEKIKNSVDSTKGQILTYNGEVIEAFYFAMSNGYTSSLVFSENKEYLQSVESAFDNNSLKNFIVTTNFNKNDFCDKLQIKCNTIEIKDIKRSSTNRVNEITINNITFKGTDVRKKLGLRSTDFEISLLNDEISITTKGYGHGVGMSQYGANGMANSGKNYQEILTYFYKNVKLSSI